jgi:hypothetical protein
MTREPAYAFHPLANGYPLLSGEELTALADAMTRDGYDVAFPIVLYEGQILDGRNRQLAADLAGIQPVYQELPAWKDPVRFIESANERRRHLSPEWLQQKRQERIARIAALRQQGQSLRQIAEAEGISLTQVHADALASGVQGGTPEADEGRTIGKDGKSYARQKTVAPATSETAPAPDAESPPPALDEVGLPIPEAMVPLFATRDQVRELLALLRQAQALVHRIALGPGGAQYRLLLDKDTKGADRPYYDRRLRAVVADLREQQPHCAICPRCRRDGTLDPHCPACRGHGWLTVWGHAHLSILDQQYLEWVREDLNAADPN